MRKVESARHRRDVDHLLEFGYGDKAIGIAHNGLQGVAGIANQRHIEIVAHSVASSRATKQFENQSIGHFGQSLGFCCKLSVEGDWLGHRTRTVEQDDECRAVTAVDRSGIVFHFIQVSLC